MKAFVEVLTGSAVMPVASWTCRFGFAFEVRLPLATPFRVPVPALYGPAAVMSAVAPGGELLASRFREQPARIAEPDNQANSLPVAPAHAATVPDQPRRPGLGFVKARKEMGAGAEVDGVSGGAFLGILDAGSWGCRAAEEYRPVFPGPQERAAGCAARDGQQDRMVSCE